MTRPGAWPCGTAASGPSPRPYDVLHDAITTQGGTWTTDRAVGLFTSAGLQVDRNTAWGLVRHFTLTDPPDTEGDPT